MALVRKQDNNRVFLLDEIRGFAILCMVVYHAFYNLVFIFGIDIPIFYSTPMNIIRDVFAGAFMFISGSACRYSRNNAKRGMICYLLGMLFTVVTAFVGENLIIRFGILHMLGASMLLFAAGETLFSKLPNKVGIPLCFVLFLLCYHLPAGRIGIPGIAELTLPYEPLYAANIYALGFPSDSFISSDYFPMLPWVFVFLAGSYFGRLLKDGRLPKLFYTSHCRPLQAIGRNTIWIYLLHQPIIYGAMELITMLRK